uniref:Carboxylic ester hydrolase n=1 Tax=Pundamilia nyererei TaxID=303518 RepID=A0A3B4GAA5_9CICH
SWLCAQLLGNLQSFAIHRANHEAASPVVHTGLGSLKGEYVSVKGKETGVHAYLGVPFAKPPLGPSLRLAPPQPAEGWEGVRDATKQPPMCIQSKEAVLDLADKLGGLLAEIPDISEDCLYLNIYSPAKRANNAKLPVMVWIHGGGFTLGSASTYDGSALAYRLGILGFLSTGDENISGNFGLLDQVEALKWIQQHIHNFGGDPGLVTIFGESAGGVSVSLLLLSPLSDGLFHRAIAESGTAAMNVFVANDPLPMAQVNYPYSSFFGGLNIFDPNLRFQVNVDGHFLTKPVDELFRKHELHAVPFMTGVNNDEGGWILPKAAFISDVIADGYIGNGDDRVKNRDGYTEMLGDLFFTIPAIKAANAHRDAGAPVYLYEYQHPPKFLQQKRPSFVGTDHADEIFTVLGFCFTTSHGLRPSWTEIAHP